MKIVFNNGDRALPAISIREQYNKQQSTTLLITMNYDSTLMDDLIEYFDNLKINEIKVYNNNNDLLLQTSKYTTLDNIFHLMNDELAIQQVYIELK